MTTSQKILHWTPRILCILSILFVSMFALDSFSPDLTIVQQLAAFGMHLLPSFVLIILLIIAWKWENIGGGIFTLIGLGLSPFIFMKNYEMNHSIGTSLLIVLTITFPFIVVGILFLWSYRNKKRLRNKEETPDSAQ